MASSLLFTIHFTIFAVLALFERSSLAQQSNTYRVHYLGQSGSSGQHRIRAQQHPQGNSAQAGQQTQSIRQGSFKQQEITEQDEQDDSKKSNNQHVGRPHERNNQQNMVINGVGEEKEKELQLTGNNSPAIHHSGRHICSKQDVEYVPVKTMQSYCKPEYKKQLVPCESGMQQLCTSFRVLYQMAFREVVQTQRQEKTVYSCCPGWRQTKLGEDGCNEPVCMEKCHNGGTCEKPDQCKCAPGWRGKDCQKDVDECSKKTHSCQQKCVNTHGSYECVCSEGFIKSEDGSECIPCLHCLPEYKEIVTSLKTLKGRVSQLEKEKEILQENLTAVVTEHHKQMESFRREWNEVEKGALPKQSALDEPGSAQATSTDPKESKQKENEIPAQLVGSTDPRISSEEEAILDATADYAGVEHYRGDASLLEEFTHRLDSLSEQVGIFEGRLDSCSCNNEP